MTVKKEKVETHIRTDGNKIYNYMVKLLLGDDIAKLPGVHIFPDERSIKVESGNSLADYLAMDQWFERKTKVQLELTPVSSAAVHNIRIADAIAHIVFSQYEDGLDEGFSTLNAVGRVDRKLFF